jgi:hypothetical protein
MRYGTILPRSSNVGKTTIFILTTSGPASHPPVFPGRVHDVLLRITAGSVCFAETGINQRESGGTLLQRRSLAVNHHYAGLAVGIR